MIEPHGSLSQVRQCQLLNLARSTYYSQPQPISHADLDLVLLRMMDEQYLKTPQYGSRSYATWFQRQGTLLGRKKASSLMKTLGIVSIAPKPRTSISSKQHKVYPYLLKELVINKPNQVWAADITYVRPSF
jgi:putative transposase